MLKIYHRLVVALFSAVLVMACGKLNADQVFAASRAPDAKAFLVPALGPSTPVCYSLRYDTRGRKRIEPLLISGSGWSPTLDKEARNRVGGIVKCDPIGKKAHGKLEEAVRKGGRVAVNLP